MDFYLWSYKNLLNVNKYGIPEPERSQIINPDIILIPLVAFDKRLYRIGYGGGYYDRYIEKLSKKKNDMDFYLWSYKNLLNVNKYGIPEPERSQIIYPDIILIPLVAFDKRFYRIGYGGGYYDRYIEKLSKKKKFIKIGIAHSCQKIKRVPNSKYDKKLDILITEKYILR